MSENEPEFLDCKECGHSFVDHSKFEETPDLGRAKECRSISEEQKRCDCKEYKS